MKKKEIKKKLKAINKLAGMFEANASTPVEIVNGYRIVKKSFYTA